MLYVHVTLAQVPLPLGLELAPWVPIPLRLIAPNLINLSEQNAHTLVVACLALRAPHPHEPVQRWLQRLFPDLQ